MATRRQTSSKAARKRTVTKQATRSARSPRRPAAARRSATRMKPRSKTSVARTRRTTTTSAKPTKARRAAAPRAKPRTVARSSTRRTEPVTDLTRPTPPGVLRAARREHERAAESKVPRMSEPTATPEGMGHHSARFAGLRDGGDTEG